MATNHPIRRLMDFPDLFNWDRFPALGSEENRLKVEQFRDDDSIVVRAEMPGVDVDNDVDVSVDDGVIRIAAERKQEKTDETDGTYRSEFSYGRFERAFRLPRDADPDSIEASYEKGVLEVRIPVSDPEVEEPKKIQISAKD